MIAPGNDRKRPLRRRFAEQRLCRVLDGVVAPRADGDPRWLGGLGQGKGQFQHAMVAVGGDVSRRRRWSGYSTTKDESWTAKVPCCRFCPCGSASEFGERERVGFRFLAPRTRPVRYRRAGRYRSGGCCSREPRRPAGGGLATAKCVASTARKSCPPAPPIAAMCWAACRRARSRLRGQSVSPPPSHPKRPGNVVGCGRRPEVGRGARHRDDRREPGPGRGSLASDRPASPASEAAQPSAVRGSGRHPILGVGDCGTCRQAHILPSGSLLFSSPWKKAVR